MTPFWSEGLPIDVNAERNQPVGFCVNELDHHVRHVSDRWRIHTNWWTGTEIWRDYWEVATNRGWLCVIYQDIITGKWYLERVYD